MPKGNGPTLKEVAEAAGVSVTAASKVLSGGQASVRVSEQTAAHVRAVAASMKYVPNAHARSLRTRKSDTIGLIFENIGHLADGSLFNAMMLDTIGKEIFRRHYRLTIFSQIDRHHSVPSLQDGRLDGLIWCKLSGAPSQLNELKALNLPFVALCSPPPEWNHPFPFISCDNVGGAGLVVDRMVELGHRRILFLLEDGEATTPDAQSRVSGFVQACEAHGIEVSEGDIRIWSFDGEEFPEWWASKPPHTAVFAWNDNLANSVLERAAQCGVAVPEELSVVGFDSTRFCETTTPKLTSVRQPIREMAHAATDYLFQLLDGETPDLSDMVFPCALDERESLGAPRPIISNR